MRCLTVVMLMAIALNGHAQNDEHGPVRAKATEKDPNKESFKERLVYGGNIGGYFGQNTFVNFNPMVGYRITDSFVAGIGANYLYFKSPLQSGSVWGKSVWSRLYFLESFYAHAEFENLDLRYRYLDQSAKDNLNVALIGLGYQSNYFGIAVLYDLIQDPNSPYSTPLIRIGGMIGIGN
jgi:hypothetical protein